MNYGFYRPTDVQAANDSYGASCGHAALAALLGREVCDLWLSESAIFNGKSYVSAPMMEAALRDVRPGAWNPVARDFPVRGLVLIQFEGSWLRPGVPFGAALARTHWVAVESAPVGGDAVQFVYDINQDGWMPRKNWQEQTFPKLLELHKRCTGWHVRCGYEVPPKMLMGIAIGQR